ncbi:MAG: RHS repeat-associated core domain-containing protein, partial [Terriglobales bacterium]
YDCCNLYYFRQADWLGSERLAGWTNRTLVSDQAYAPYGEAYDATGGWVDRSFTGQQENLVRGVYDFPFREYSPAQGRWLSPDPAGLAAVNPADPQTWNAYAYVANQPLGYTDPLGLGTINVFTGCTGGNDGPYGAWVNCTDPGSIYLNDPGALSDLICGSGEPYQQLDPSCRQFASHSSGETGGSAAGGGTGASGAANTSGKPAPVGAGCPAGAGLGLQLGASAEAGIGLAGAGAQTTAFVGAFDSPAGASVGALQSGGATAYAGGAAAGAPSQAGLPRSIVLGAFAGASVIGGEVTNAGSPSALAGPFDTWSFNIGFGPQLTVQFARSATGTWTLSVSAGPGVGLDLSRYQTDTVVRAGGGC